MVATIFFIIFALASVVCLIFSLYRSVELKNDPKEQVDWTLYFKREIPLLLGFTVAFTTMLILIYPMANITPKVYEGIQAVIGGIIFSSSISCAINAFIVHYYRKNIPEKLDKILFAATILGFSLAVVTLFITLNGYADYFSYPLVNGISFKEGFVNPSRNANVAFYAICILTGALFVYFLADHKLYMEYGEHGLLESTFLVAFPGGIVGARLFYVIGNFNVPVSQGGFGGVISFDMLAIWNGGLTILGGAVVGIVLGVAWFMSRHKNCNIWLVMDVCVPAILIAQAIGRWGNFFNCEVHGLASNESYWWWLPRVVFNNAHWTTSSGVPTQLTDGNLYVPLFLIEGMMNIFGYCLLAHLFGKALRKYTELGDLAFGYIAWYGLTRTMLEPLRDPSYNMGEDGYWSWVWSMVFIVVGCLLILLNHLVRYILRKKKGEVKVLNSKNQMITLVVLLGVFLLTLIVSIILLLTGNYTGKIAFNEFNFGIIILILSISILFISVIPVLNLVQSKQAKTE